MIIRPYVTFQTEAYLKRKLTILNYGSIKR